VPLSLILRSARAQATVLQRYQLTAASEPALATEQLCQLIDMELTYDEFAQGLCLLAQLHHRAHAAGAAQPRQAPAEAVEGAAADQPAAPAVAGPPADAALAEVYAHFLEHVVAPRVAEYRLQQQLKAMQLYSEHEHEEAETTPDAE
jgi:hypothetical protein